MKKGLYSSEEDRMCDVIIANSSPMFTPESNGKLRASNELDKTLHAESKANAVAKLAIDKAMRTCPE